MKTRTNQPVFYDNGTKVDDSALGGTKLYEHIIKIINITLVEDGASNDMYIKLISNSSEEINSVGKLAQLLENISSSSDKQPIITKMIVSDSEYNETYGRLHVCSIDSSYRFLGIRYNTGDYNLHDLQFFPEDISIKGSITDTVTPL